MEGAAEAATLDVRRSLVNGGRFETCTQSGTRIWFRLMTGRDERRAAKYLRGDANILAGLAMRIDEIEGIDKSKKVEFLEDLEGIEHRDLLDAFDEADGGVDTNIEVECPSCGAIFPIDLPFDQGFFMPRKKSRKR